MFKEGISGRGYTKEERRGRKGALKAISNVQMVETKARVGERVGGGRIIIGEGLTSQPGFHYETVFLSFSLAEKLNSFLG